MTLPLTIPDRAPDWQDCHAGALVPPETTARDAFVRALDNAPGWVGAAMWLRNLMGRPFGITPATLDDRADFLNRMPVVTDQPDHFETGLTDRHLTFTLSVDTQPGHVAATTRIWFHNLVGRLYLRAVLPVHRHLMRRMLRGLAQ